MYTRAPESERTFSARSSTRSRESVAWVTLTPFFSRSASRALCEVTSVRPRISTILRWREILVWGCCGCSLIGISLRPGYRRTFDQGTKRTLPPGTLPQASTTRINELICNYMHDYTPRAWPFPVHSREEPGPNVRSEKRADYARSSPPTAEATALIARARISSISVPLRVLSWGRSRTAKASDFFPSAT